MTAHLRLLAGAAFLFTVERQAAAAVVTLPTADRSARGWYDSSGSHDSANDNYLAGAYADGPYRNFFIFTLPTLQPDESIVSASLILYCPLGGYSSSDPLETYQIFALENTSIAALQTGGDGLTNIYADLGDGTAYSTGVVLTAASSGTDVIIPLNGAFLAYAGMHSGGAIALGGALTSAVDGGSCFNGSGSLNGITLNQTRLNVTVVPEPSVALLLVTIVAIPWRQRGHPRTQYGHNA
jgi:hypothetical protein